MEEIKKTPGGLRIVNKQQLIDHLNGTLKTNRGVVLLGESGKGKTTYLTNWLNSLYPNKLIHPYAPFMYTPRELAKLVNALGTEFFDKSNLRLSKSSSTRKATPIYIDDIKKHNGKANHFQLTVAFIEELIDIAYEEKIPFYCTSNLSLAELETSYGKHIVSRLGDMSDILYLEGPDFRAIQLHQANNTPLNAKNDPDILSKQIQIEPDIEPNDIELDFDFINDPLED